MPAPTIRVEGLDELRRDLRRVKDEELDDEMKEIHVTITKEITQRADPPYETGRLYASIRAKGTVKDAIGRAGSKSVPYAPIIHWGWAARGIPARPFLRESAEVIERDIEDRYEREVARMLDRVVGRT